MSDELKAEMADMARAMFDQYDKFMQRNVLYELHEKHGIVAIKVLDDPYETHGLVTFYDAKGVSDVDMIDVGFHSVIEGCISIMVDAFYVEWVNATELQRNTERHNFLPKTWKVTS